jgi:hypothetical protein
MPNRSPTEPGLMSPIWARPDPRRHVNILSAFSVILGEVAVLVTCKNLMIWNIEKKKLGSKESSHIDCYSYSDDIYIHDTWMVEGHILSFSALPKATLYLYTVHLSEVCLNFFFF